MTRNLDALIDTASSGNLEALKSILAASGNVNYVAGNKMCALHAAARFEHPEAIGILLDAGADANANFDHNGWSALAVVLAWQLQPLEVRDRAVVAHLNAGADVYVTGKERGCTAYDIAKEHGCVPLLTTAVAAMKIRDGIRGPRSSTGAPAVEAPGTRLHDIL